MVWSGTRASGSAGEPEAFNLETPYEDPVALLGYREHLAWEKNVKIASAKVARNLRQ